MSLNLFNKIEGLPEDKLHPKFLQLRDNVLLEGERKILEDWTQGFIDRDNKIVMEFQATFHSSFWEFYLHKVLIEAGCKIDFSQERPDFMVESPHEINLEAVVSNIKQGGKTETKRTLEDILSMVDPPYLHPNFNLFIDESIVRNSNAILSKNKKYLPAI